MLAEALLKGLAAGGWVIGFIVSVGTFLLIVGGTIHLLIYAFGSDEDDKGRK